MMDKNIIKLQTYSWHGINSRGELIQGEQAAKSINLLKMELRKQGVKVKKIQKKISLPWQTRKLSSREVTLFTRQMATLLQAGVPIMQALEAIQGNFNHAAARAMIINLKSDIEAGVTVANALSKYPECFNSLYRNLIAAGEQSGLLASLFERIATYKEKMESLQGKIKRALYYPLSVLAIAFIINTLLLIFVVPQFEALFANFGAALPVATLMVINLSKFLQSYGWLMIILIGVIAFGFRFSRKHFLSVAVIIDHGLLKLPIGGVILKNAVLARFSRTLNITVDAGMPLVNALQLVAGVTGNHLYNSATMTICEHLTAGNSLQNAMQRTGLFPNIMVQMIGIGEESGTLDKMLMRLANLYESEVDNAIDGLSSLLEPLIMLVLGVIIGGLVIAMYLPIFKIGTMV